MGTNKTEIHNIETTDRASIKCTDPYAYIMCRTYSLELSMSEKTEKTSSKLFDQKCQILISGYSFAANLFTAEYFKESL